MRQNQYFPAHSESALCELQHIGELLIYFFAKWEQNVSTKCLGMDWNREKWIFQEVWKYSKILFFSGQIQILNQFLHDFMLLRTLKKKEFE